MPESRQYNASIIKQLESDFHKVTLRLINRLLTKQFPPPLPRQSAVTERGIWILRGQSYKIIKKETVIGSLTTFARKRDLKIFLAEAP